MPPLSAIGAVVVLAVTVATSARGALGEHERVLNEMLQLRRRSEGQLWMGILDATAMSITHPDDFLDAVLHEAARELEVRRCSLVLAGEGERLHVRAAVGLAADALGQEVPRDGSLAGWVFDNGDVLSSTNLPEELAAKRRGRGYQSEAFVCHPVQYGLRILGVLNVSDRNDGGIFSPSDEIAVAEAADKLALVLARLGRTAGAWDSDVNEPRPASQPQPLQAPAEPKARRLDTASQKPLVEAAAQREAAAAPDALTAEDSPDLDGAAAAELGSELMADLGAELEAALPEEFAAEVVVPPEESDDDEPT